LNYETIFFFVIPHLIERIPMGMRDPDPPSSQRNMDSRLRGNDNSSAYPRGYNSSAYPRGYRKKSFVIQSKKV